MKLSLIHPGHCIKFNNAVVMYLGECSNSYSELIAVLNPIQYNYDEALIGFDTAIKFGKIDWNNYKHIGYGFVDENSKNILINKLNGKYFYSKTLFDIIEIVVNKLQNIDLDHEVSIGNISQVADVYVVGSVIPQ